VSLLLLLGGGGAPAPAVLSAPSSARGSLFFCVEIEAYRYGSAAVAQEGWGAWAWGAPMPVWAELESTETIRASDIGYRTRDSDAGGLVAYPPLLETAFALDRSVTLSPADAAVAAAWGSVRLANLDRRFDAIVGTRSPDGRNARVLAGRRTRDAARGLELDPPRAQLVEVLAGVATAWFLDATALDVPLRDASYWIERPYQSSAYLGTGTYEGGADLTGKSRPRTRGGTASFPVREVAPLLIDTVNRIYQYTDGPGTVVALYEGGDTNITFQADTTNLYSGSTSAGQYRTDNSRGLIQLGSIPTRTITVDCTGAFPVAGAQSLPGSLARYMLAEDMLLPADMLDADAFTALDAAAPYIMGWHWPSGDESDGAGAVGVMLASCGAKLLPGRDRKLRPLLLRAIPDGAAPAASFGEDRISDVTPTRLAAPLDPPPYRWRVGYQRVHTVQTTDLDPDVTTARRQFLADADRYAGWSSSAVSFAYRRPSDPPPLATALLVQADAQALADALGALWGAERRRLYDVVVPLSLGLGVELGDVVRIAFPLDSLGDGRLGRVVGEGIRSADAGATLRVLV
jgi:hypothetical protein